MNKSSQDKSLDNICTTFNNWLFTNHDELLKHDVVYSLSLIEKKWEDLKTEYVNFHIKKFSKLINSNNSDTFGLHHFCYTRRMLS